MMSKLYQVSNGFIYFTEKDDEDGEEVMDMIGEEPKKKKKIPRKTVFFNSQPKIEALKEIINGLRRRLHDTPVMDRSAA